MAAMSYSLEIIILYHCIFGLLVLLAIFLNCLVIWIIYGHIPLKTAFTALLCGISIADVLYMGLVVMFELNSYLELKWSFGKAYCHIYNFFLYAPVIFKGLLLIFLAAERNFNLILVQPGKRFYHSSALKLIAGSGLISTLIALPIAIRADIENGHCLSNYSSEQSVRSLVDGIVIVTSHILPLIFLLFSSISIVYASRGQSNTRNDEKYLENRRSAIGSSRTCIILLCVAFISWMPYSIVLLLLFPQIITVNFHTLMSIYGLKLSSSVTFPLVYFIFHKRFNQRFLSRCKLQKRDIYTIKEENLSTKENTCNDKPETIFQEKAIPLFSETL